MRQDAHVLIAGGGLGGLCLAQGLAQAGVRCTVFERDEAPFARPQGYRLSLSPEGLEGLQANLPPDLWAEIGRETTPQADAIPFVAPDLRELFRKPITAADGSPQRRLSIDRVALRRTLLSGLADVRYSKKLVSYEDAGDGVSCRFEDGSTAAGDLLVGTEGTRSVVRGRLLGASNLVETGIVSITGQIPCDEETDRDLEAPPLGTQAVVVDRTPQGLFIASHRNAAASGWPTGYAYWALLARRDWFPGELDGMEPSELKRVALEKTAHWHERLRRLLGRTSVATMRVVAYETSTRPRPWPAGRVAIMGDAIHNMPPTAGQGANMALKDAGALRAAITGGGAGAGDVTAAVARYHEDMIAYAFPQVDEAMRNMGRMVTR